MDVSLLCSGIRTELWASFFESIFRSSASMSVEIICVSPRPLPEALKHDGRIKYKQDLGSPARGVQIAASMATGSRIAILTDDAMMEPGAQDVIWESNRNQDRKTVVLGKYTEGEGTSRGGRKNWKFQLADNYYKVNSSSYTASSYIPNEWSIANSAYVDRDYFIELGGWDCRFESHAIPSTDWAIRAQRDGAKFILVDIKVFHLNWDPNPSNPSAICRAFNENDWPLYRSIYDDPNCVDRIKINFDNWKQSPEIWARRKN